MLRFVPPGVVGPGDVGPGEVGPGELGRVEGLVGPAEGLVGPADGLVGLVVGAVVPCAEQLPFDTCRPLLAPAVWLTMVGTQPAPSRL
jgi:hypothetical protein